MATCRTMLSYLSFITGLSQDNQATLKSSMRCRLSNAWCTKHITKASPSTPSFSYKNPANQHEKTIPKHKSTKCSTKAPLPAHTVVVIIHHQWLPRLLSSLPSASSWLPPRTAANPIASPSVAQPGTLPDRRAQAQCVRQRARRRRQCWPGPAQGMLPAAEGAAGPRGRSVPLHCHQGQRPGHRPRQRARWPGAHPQQLRQELPEGLHLPP